MANVTPLTDDSRMSFGKWAGERLGDVPDEYFEWLSAQAGFKFKHPALWNYLNKSNASDSNSSDFDLFQHPR